MVAFASAVALAIVSAYLLLPQRVVQTRWAAGTEATRAADVALVIDTRGAPLRVEGANPGGSDVEGRGGVGFEFEGFIRASETAPTIVRLIDPSGSVVWRRTVEAGHHGRIPTTVLHAEGVWGLEVSARGRATWLELTGYLRTSRWEGAPWGTTLPISWLVAGLVAAVAMWFGAAGARLAGTLLLLTGITMPFATLGSRDLFVVHPPGEGVMVATTGLLAFGGALLLGSTWSRPGERVEGLAAAIAGALLLAAGYASFRAAGPCVENPCLPFEQLDEIAAEAGMLTGSALLALGGWAIGRRSTVAVTEPIAR